MRTTKFDKKTEAKIAALIEEHKGNWPEDDWFGLSESLDINLWISLEGKNKATVYDVVDGNTQTDHWVEVL